MACLDMYNSNEHNKGSHCAPMSPRISFSNDFAETQQMIKQERIISSREAPPPVSSDFEFSVTNNSMMSADELFFKGKLLPFKESCNSQMQRTLREELLVDDDHDQVSNSLRPPKGSSSTTTRWRGLLGGRKRTHIGSKKADKTTTTDIGSGDKMTTRSIFAQQEQAHHSKTSQQEFLSEGGGSS
ncbi:hypothetical protein LWI28_019155 [Acer negundo]|uniref:Uncharacterized protein n=1 Tax=Acer negundo TaxID=4023 RepID=A0AAD5NLX8_ACENE|nr:hypothetical protein LWI28_019155 [Acer negundo]KAK4840553.1 hypothetical protein QYF36_011895 [Acer negundo]